MIKMNIKTSATIKTSSDKVWKVLADEFLDISKWARDVNDSYDNFSTNKKLDGAPSEGRFCEVSGFGKVDEQIIHFDKNKRELTWTANADKMPSFVNNLQNAWQVEEIDNSTTQVTSNISADLTGILGVMMYPLMKMNFSKLVKGFIEDLSSYAISGHVSSTKKKQLDKLGSTTAIPH